MNGVQPLLPSRELPRNPAVNLIRRRREIRKQSPAVAVRLPPCFEKDPRPMKNSQVRQCSLPLIAVFCILPQTLCFAEGAPVNRQELSKWVMTYYQNPVPDELVQKVKEMSAAGLLHDPGPNARPDANVMFIGKIMAANAKQIPEWMDALSSLPDAEIKVLKRAVWYSGTAQGTAWLIKNGEADLANGPRPMLLANKQAMEMQPYHIDQLWEWFFATGEEEPIARIISLFSLAHELPNEKTLDLLAPPTESDDKTQSRIQLYNYRLLKPALWSTTSLAINHDRVLEILKQAEKKHYHAGIKAWVGQVVRIAEAERAKRKKPQPDTGKKTP
jgi:hypothetical protein